MLSTSRRLRPPLAVAFIVGLIFAPGIFLASPNDAGADETVIACGPGPNSVFVSLPSALVAEANCPHGELALEAINGVVNRGTNVIWQASAPHGLFIRSVSVPTLYSTGVNAGSQGAYGGDFYWAGASSNIVPGESSASFPNIDAPDFGFNLVCGLAHCDNSVHGAEIFVYQAILTVGETLGPSLNSPSGLWQTDGWIRGVWSLPLSGDSPSGMCSLSASLADRSLPGSTTSPNQAIWHQCSASSIDDPVPTSAYPDGADTLRIAGTDAAGEQAALSKTIYVDNQQPRIALTGPTDAPSTAGTQYVTATAAAGPSGVAGISCSVDGAPAQWFAASTAQIPVAAVPGEHQVQCFSQNNAKDASGAAGQSATQTFTMKIGEPTIAAVAFSKVVNKLRCHRTVRRVRVPARWVKVRRHGKLVRVHRRARVKREKVTRCHPRTVRRLVTRVVTVRRHGKRVRVKRREMVRVVLEPRTVYKTSRRVAHGKATTVNGWLGTADGTALGGQTVDVLTAADNGRNNYHVAAVTTTAANGAWSARLPAGPSRLVTAAYQGSATTESTASAPAHLVVPAKVQLLSISPRQVPWGAAVHLVGRLRGGYLPPGGALVRLRIGEGSAVTTYGVREHVTGNGRFTTIYRFGAGDPGVHRSFFFQVASLPMGDYPWAPATSRRLTIRVGGHPKPPPPPHHRRKRHR